MHVTKETEEFQTQYLDVYKGVTSYKCYTLGYDENSDISTTYFGRAHMQRSDKCRAKEYFNLLISLALLIVCWMVLNVLYFWIQELQRTSYLKPFYMNNRCLHLLPKFTSKCKSIYIRNGAFVSILFIISVIIEVHRLRLKIYTTVPDKQDNVDMANGVKNFVEL